MNFDAETQKKQHPFRDLPIFAVITIGIPWLFFLFFKYAFSQLKGDIVKGENYIFTCALALGFVCGFAVYLCFVLFADFAGDFKIFFKHQKEFFYDLRHYGLQAFKFLKTMILEDGIDFEAEILILGYYILFMVLYVPPALAYVL